MWFETNNRKFMEYILEESMKQFGGIVQNRLLISWSYTISIVLKKHPQITIVYYVRELLEEPEKDNVLKVLETRNMITEDFFSRDTSKECRKKPLSKTIQYKNICIPILHVFKGLVKDIYNLIANEFKADRQHSSALTKECENFLKSFKVPRQEF
uniref:Cytochrome P450 n=1 Tax=Strongyloides venezuelensis TaxID=75913 RepID=A0A0K0FDD5_STRVS